MRGISWLFGRDGGEGGSLHDEELRRRILRAAVQAAGLGLLLLAIYGFSVVAPRSVAAYLSGVARTFSTFAVVGGACFLSGALLGFLFGVPKTLQGTVTADRQTAYKINTSFEEISDWLTKMIIGVGLVELKNIPPALMTLNEYVARAAPHEGAEAVIGATVVFFSAAGLLVGYLSTRLYISRAFKSADEEMNRRLENAANAAAAALEGGTPAGGGGGGGGSTASTDASARAVKGDTPIPPEATDPRVQKLVDVIENTDVSAGDIGPSAARSAALALYLNEKYDEALPYFERAGAPELFDEGLALKYAIALGESGQRTRAVNFLLRMIKRRKGIPDAYKLLGYFYLWIPEKLDASIDNTNRYLAQVQNDDGGLFNLACAYAQLFGRSGDAADRKSALDALQRAIAANPSVWKKRALEFIIADFWALKEDPEFQALVK